MEGVLDFLDDDDRDLKLVLDGSILDKVGPPNELLKGVLPVGTSMLFSDSNVGKSFLAMDWGVHIAAGLPWQGHKVCRPGTVVHLFTEGTTGFANRKSAAKRKAGITGRIPYLGVTSPVKLGGSVDDKQRKGHVEQLKAVAYGINRLIDAEGLPAITLVIFDTVFQTNRGNENATEDMSCYLTDAHTFMETLNLEHHTTPVSALFVHHTGLAGGESRARGSQAMRAHVDAELKLSGGGRAPKSIFLEVTKQRDIAALDKRALLLDVVPVFDEKGDPLVDEDGDVITTCVVDVPPSDDTKDRILREVKVYLALHPGATQNEVEKAVDGKAIDVRLAFKQAKATNPYDS